MYTSHIILHRICYEICVVFAGKNIKQAIHFSVYQFYSLASSWPHLSLNLGGGFGGSGHKGGAHYSHLNWGVVSKHGYSLQLFGQ